LKTTVTGKKNASKIDGGFGVISYMCLHNVSLYEIQTLPILCANTQNITIAGYQRKEGGDVP
jgi:hypothetical protein